MLTICDDTVYIDIVNVVNRDNENRGIVAINHGVNTVLIIILHAEIMTLTIKPCVNTVLLYGLILTYYILNAVNRDIDSNTCVNTIAMMIRFI